MWIRGFAPPTPAAAARRESLRPPSPPPAAVRAMCAAVAVLVLLAAPTLAGPFTDGNLIVTTNDTVFEFTPAGTEVQSIFVQYGGGPRPVTETVRDAIFDANGQLMVFDGTFSPYLNAYDAFFGEWSHDTEAGWSTINNVSYGGIGGEGPYIFVTDMATAGAGAPQGIVRFNRPNGTALRFAEAQGTIDLTVGLNGGLYALSAETAVRIYDTETLALAGSITLAAACRGIAVAQNGEVFGASWDGNIYRFDASGAVITSLPTGAFNLTDIDLRQDGSIVVGSRFGDVIQTDVSLSGAETFTAGTSPVFVAFVTQPTTGIAAAQPAPTFRLLSNVPNPFNPSTTIRFTLAHEASIRLAVFDGGGRVVRVLMDGTTRAAGPHDVVWDGRDAQGRVLPSGVYFHELRADGRRATGRMVLAR